MEEETRTETNLILMAQQLQVLQKEKEELHALLQQREEQLERERRERETMEKQLEWERKERETMESYLMQEGEERHAVPQQREQPLGKIPLQEVDESELDVDSVFDVMREVLEVTRWFDLGLALGLSFFTLETIKMDCGADVHECKKFMLRSWLQMNYNYDEKGLPSLRSLVAGLRDPLVNYPDIAEAIAKKYPSQVSVTAPPQPAAESELQNTLENVDDSHLDDASLFDVMREVLEVTRWFDLGLALGLSFTKLETIKMDCRADICGCKSYMLRSWLRMDYDVSKKGPPSWRFLVAVLRDPLVNYPDIAEAIAKKYPSQVSVTTPPQPPAESELQNTLENVDDSHLGSCVPYRPQMRVPKPESKDLHHLPIKDWYALGLKLHLRDFDLYVIKNDGGGTQVCIRRMFQAWLTQQPDASYQQLVNALCKIKQNKVARDLCKNYPGLRMPTKQRESGPEQPQHGRAIAKMYPSQVSVTAPPQPAAESELQNTLENVDDSYLDVDSAFDVMREVFEVTRWFDLGLALGLSFFTLEAIKMDCRADIRGCKSYMLQSWLLMDYDVSKKGPPSWRSLVAVLRDPLVNYPDIAEAIAKKYPKRQSA